jgi:hypothetical protein
MRRAPALALALVEACALLSACKPSTSPQDVLRDARPFTPPPAYAALWRGLERCSGLRGDYASVRFYTVDSLDNHAVGRTVGRSVYLVRLFRDSEPVVRHEMLHVLLQRNGHPAQYFRGPCGNLGEQ